jgi:hypothetical protein
MTMITNGIIRLEADTHHMYGLSLYARYASGTRRLIHDEAEALRLLERYGEPEDMRDPLWWPTNGD